MDSANITQGAKCPKETAQNGPSLFQNGNLVFQAHHVGWIVTGLFTVVATVASFWLVNKHLQWYTNKREQRYIVRLLFMVPIYAIISFASYLFWNHSTPLLLIRDGYESTVLTAFFYLLLMYLSPNAEEQQLIFLKLGLSREADREARKKGEEPKKWVFPLRFIKWKPQDGLYFLQLMKWGVLQYCVIRPTTTLAAVILDYAGLYCEESWGLGWGHIYITIIVSLSVTIAMYCLIQLYVPIAACLAPHKPLLKLFAVKAVVFLTFWQATFLSVLSMLGVVKDTKYMTAADINIGIGALIETFEMMCFAFLHIRAFTYKSYQPIHSRKSEELPPTRTPRLHSLGHAMDFRETFREIWIGWIYILDKMRGREPAPDVGARRAAHYEEAFGRLRPSHITAQKDLDSSTMVRRETDQPALPALELERRTEVDLEGERHWLDIGEDFGRRSGHTRRERSDDLEVQIERELERRGYVAHFSGRRHIRPHPEAEAAHDHRKQHSWWRSIYSRISQSGTEPEEEQTLASLKHTSHSRRRQPSGHVEAGRGLLSEHDGGFDDPPPPSVIHAYRGQHRRERKSRTEDRRLVGEEDILAPLPTFNEPRSSRQQQIHMIPVAEFNSFDPNPINILPENTNADGSNASLLSKSVEYMRSDSLLGRIFPRSPDSESTDHGPLSDSTQSVSSVSMNGTSRSRGTPRARLTNSTPEILAQGYEFGIKRIASRTQHRYQEVPTASTVEIVNTPPLPFNRGTSEISELRSPHSLHPPDRPLTQHYHKSSAAPQIHQLQPSDTRQIYTPIENNLQHSDLVRAAPRDHRPGQLLYSVNETIRNVAVGYRNQPQHPIQSDRIEWGLVPDSPSRYPGVTSMLDRLPDTLHHPPTAPAYPIDVINESQAPAESGLSHPPHIRDSHSISRATHRHRL